MTSPTRVALIHQAARVPAVGGVVKPMKPGGYTDSCADLAYALHMAGETVITPTTTPDPTKDLDWSFPDTANGITDALHLGANTLWANTILHSRHALVTLRDKLVASGVRIVGQNPWDVERFDDKEWTNRWLAEQEGLRDAFPKSVLLEMGWDEGVLRAFEMPMVTKPVRGRGSSGVSKVETREEMRKALNALFEDSTAVMVEEYLAGEEITVTVMPPGDYSIVGRQSKHWSLPVVTRFGQINGVAPWNGTVPVTRNSRILSSSEHAADSAYKSVQDRCALVGKLCNAFAPLRIDCRRRTDAGEFMLFDVNLKPNATGPGRPGRETQAALTTMSAEGVGWDFPLFIVNTLHQARPATEVLRPPT